jgi:hypothetical protein
LKFYDGDGNLALTLDTAVDTGSSSSSSADFKIEKNGSSRKGLFTQNGFMSSGSFLTDDALPTNQHYGSVLGVLKEKFFTAFGIRAGVIGMDATSHTTDNPSYGGWFNTLFAGGLNLAVRQVTANYTCNDEDFFLSVYGGTIMKLPANPRPGRVIFIRRNTTTDLWVDGNGKSLMAPGLVADVRMGSDSGRGNLMVCIFDGTNWTFNRQGM